MFKDRLHEFSEVTKTEQPAQET